MTTEVLLVLVLGAVVLLLGLSLMLQRGLMRELRSDLTEARREAQDGAREARTELTSTLNQFSQTLQQQMGSNTTTQNSRIDGFASQLAMLIKSNEERLAEVRNVLENKLRELQQDNATRLEEMRKTVDERLQTTLEKRLGESFSQVSQHLEQVLKGIEPLAPIEVPLIDSVGCVLAEDVRAPWPLPSFDNSSMDGYAVIAADVAQATRQRPVRLRVVDDVPAGFVATESVQPGTAVRIMTGAPLPAGCDAIVMVEDTERAGESGVRINRAVTPGDGIRRAGSDVVKGDVPLRAGTVVTAAVQAVLSTVNARTVSVWPRPRVGVISTGDELVDDGSPLQPGQIRESNRTMLLTLVADAGCEAVDLGSVRDDEAALEAVLRDAASSCDAIVTSGGVSMGDYDVVKAVLSRIADMSWMQIAIRPAKPFAFGLLAATDGRSVPVFGLPGNPVSSLVSFELIARPALEVMMHTADSMSGRRRVKGIIDYAVERQPDGKIHFDRCVASWGADGRIHVARVAAQASHQLAATALANALVEIPDGHGVGAGDEVLVTLLGAGGHLPTTA